jgi:hypothetical protein
MQLFSADAKVFSKNLKKIFAPQNMKKLPSKVAHNRPQTFFSELVWLPRRPPQKNSVPLKAP